MQLGEIIRTTDLFHHTQLHLPLIQLRLSLCLFWTKKWELTKVVHFSGLKHNNVEQHKNVLKVSCFHFQWWILLSPISEPRLLPVLSRPWVPHHVSVTTDREFAEGGGTLATGHRARLWGTHPSFWFSQHWHHVSVTFFNKILRSTASYC